MMRSRRGLMGLGTTCKYIVFVVCLWVLVVNPLMVECVRSVGMSGEVVLEKSEKMVNVGRLERMRKAVAPSSFGFERMSKRRVQRGPDPIHNKC
ncbi:hypothetical protein IHE45_18G069500 [Dioscorea alata]|uniref:Uncharacterized protein n=1 Tax=Dioscorea alata TaxID=55571 RepID=A0ACB7U7P3_DIOAL|nr:hypothetical protein IHE45_18G069500 [Dioscorea alata]